VVYNIKSKTQRIIKLTPTNQWGGTGLLGVTIRADDYAAAEDRLLRILHVEKNSPAAIAGLTPLKDYLLGTTTESFENEDILAHVLQNHIDRVFEVYVYSTETDVVRVVSIMPTLSWGGPGLLGCEVGRGYLHRLPSTCRTTNGISFERKIRMGARSTSTRSKPSSLEPSTVEITSPTTTTAGLGDETTVISSKIPQETTDASSITCAISGNVVHAEPHIELELETETDERKFVTLTEITTVATTQKQGKDHPAVNKETNTSGEYTVVATDQNQEKNQQGVGKDTRELLGDLPPPPNLLGYDFGKMDDIQNGNDEFSMNILPPLPPHLSTMSHYE